MKYYLLSNDELTAEAFEIANALSNNKGFAERQAKIVLNELANRVRMTDIRAHRKQDGILIANGFGFVRYLTWTERLIFNMTGMLPRRV